MAAFQMKVLSNIRIQGHPDIVQVCALCLGVRARVSVLHTAVDPQVKKESHFLSAKRLGVK